MQSIGPFLLIVDIVQIIGYNRRKKAVSRSERFTEVGIMITQGKLDRIKVKLESVMATARSCDANPAQDHKVNLIGLGA
jgi:hypothetical protein